MYFEYQQVCMEYNVGVKREILPDDIRLIKDLYRRANSILGRSIVADLSDQDAAKMLLPGRRAIILKA